MKEFIVRRMLPIALGILRAVTPSMKHVIVTGYPSTEGNAVEVVKVLLARYPGKVIWVRPPSPSFIAALGLRELTSQLRLVRRASVAALLYYITAEAIFFTHGLYGEPPALARKPTVNVCHGAGPKRTGSLFPRRKLHSKPADFIVGATSLWGGHLALASGMAESDLILSGYPRNDDLFRPADDEKLVGLGIDPKKPFIFWMPSYRTAQQSGTMRAWSDSGDKATDARLSEIIASGVRRLTTEGFTVVVKPHPMDAVNRDVDGAVLIDDAALEAAGLSLYSLLGAARALISDVSSVFSDFLLLDRPIGFFFPDADSYREGRGLFPLDVMDWLPGQRLLDDSSFLMFANDIRNAGVGSREMRLECITRIGMVQTSHAADELLDSLSIKSPSSFGRSLRPVRGGAVVASNKAKRADNPPDGTGLAKSGATL